MAAASALFSRINRTYHVRSSSMPSSRSHPVHEKVEENLTQLRQWEESALPSTSSSSLCNALSGLSDLYQSIDDLLQLPQTQQGLSCSTNKKCVEEVLDGSLRLLDSFGTTRDIILQIADAVKDLQLALRRRSGVPAYKSTEMVLLEKGIGSYMALAKKMKLKATKCLKALNIKTQKSDSHSQLVEVMTVLRNATSIAISILEQLLSFVFPLNPVLLPMKKKRSSLVLKWIGSGRVSCEEIKEYDQVKIKTQEELSAFLDDIQGLEVGLDVLQRRLIQTRVSLLNILSH